MMPMELEMVRIPLGLVLTNFPAMNEVFSIKFVKCDEDVELSQFFSSSIESDVHEFNIPALPIQLRIPVWVLNVSEYQQRLARTPLKRMGAGECFAFSDSQVCVLAFQFLEEGVERLDYLKAIRHECIHVLQHIASKVPPHEMIWLYESVACAVADQYRPLPANPPSWSDFASNFYASPDCYAVAYHFGKALLDSLSIRDLIALSVKKEECLRVSRRVYELGLNRGCVGGGREAQFVK